MSLFSKIRQKAFNEIIDLIEWRDDTADTMIWRFPGYRSEIKNGAQLIVRKTQVAVLVNEGRLAEVYQPGCYQLTTNNMPILTTLKGWNYGFDSPFKVDIYFVNTKQFLNLRWGAATPTMMQDPEFGSIKIYVFGSYSLRIESNPIKFIRNVAVTDGSFTTDSITKQLRNFVMSKFTDYLVESKIAVLDLATNLKEFSNELIIALKDDFLEYGIELTKFLIENILLPANVEEALNKRTTSLRLSRYTQKTNLQNRKPPKDLSNDGHTHNTVGINPQQSAPPPTPFYKVYYVAVNGMQQGPFRIAQLQQMVQQGEFTPDTLVWTTGMESWAFANSEPSLSQLFGVIPPPL